MALPALNATFASSADLPRKQMLAKWLVEELGETQAPSDVLVSGLSDTQYNGLYVYDGEFLGKPIYNLSSNNSVVLKWNISTWTLQDLYGGASSDSDVAYPWLAVDWYNEGIDPTGIVLTEIPKPSPLSNYYSLPERYLWAKIAVAAGGPKTEADYISLPKNYVWSDIYNVVSGDIANSTVVVSGLSDAQYNGSYVYDGLVNGRPSYRLNAGVFIYWHFVSWTMVNDSTSAQLISESDVAYPWLATGWIDEGIDPTNLVLTPQTPNHTDWTEKQALGHIAAAYRGDTGNPANLATYIDWPWRYKVASIIDHLIGNYNAVVISGSSPYNGIYTKRGIFNNKPYYTLIGTEDGVPDINSISWNGSSWIIWNGSGDIDYQSSENVNFPWLIQEWILVDGEEPTPNLTPTNV